MTDRHAGYIVTLAEDVREDDAEAVLTALRMVKGVSSAEPIVADREVHIAQTRAHQLWRDELVKLIRNGPGEASRLASR